MRRRIHLHMFAVPMLPGVVAVSEPMPSSASTSLLQRHVAASTRLVQDTIDPDRWRMAQAYSVRHI
ncbi:hypothetical protein RHOFW104R3_18770 [Rhodanobacter denitrificans]|nr:hypothetical protein RHOFW104R3_18770 [Rhodanobacter denitrificans]